MLKVGELLKVYPKYKTEWVPKIIKAKIPTYSVLFSTGSYKQDKMMIIERENHHLRFLSPKIKAVPGSIMICENKSFFATFEDNNYISVIIESEQIAKAMMIQFEALWQKAKTIENMKY